MDHSFFTAHAIAQDKRNTFTEYKGNLSHIPDGIKSFYREFNPVDVEIDYNGIGVRFYKAEELSNLQEEYAYLNAQFVFATCNGDPIFVNDRKVYTCPHGISLPKWEMLAESFDEYLQILVNQH